MRYLRPLLLVLGALVAVVVLAACASSNDKSGGQAVLDAKIGLVQSLSGAAESYGLSVQQGVDLAVSEIDDADADRLKLSILLLDDRSDVETGRQAFESLTSQGVTAILGPTLSNVALQVMPVAQAASIPVLGVTTTAQGVTEIGDYVFRVALTEAVVVPATIARVHKDKPIARAVLILDSSDAFSRSSADAMRSGMQAIGGQIVSEIDVSKADIASALDGLKGESFDTFLVTPLVEESEKILEAINGGGFDQTIIGGNSFNTLSIAGVADGDYVGAAWNPAVDTQVSKRFVNDYTAKYGAAPDLFAAQGYSAVYLLRDALLRAGTTDAPALRDALASISGVETPLGDITMSANREVVHAPVVQRFEGGKLVVLP